MDERIYTKIKYSAKESKTTLSWRETTKNGFDEHSLVCCDLPRPELVEALDKLRTHVAEILELPAQYLADASVTSVSLSYSGDDGVMGATITTLKPLANSNAPFVLNTPHKTAEPISAGGDPSICLSFEAVAAIKVLCAEADLYVNGDRAQGDLWASRQEAA